MGGMISVDTSERGLAVGRMLAGPGGLPTGARIVGKVEGLGRMGALVLLSSGVYVQMNGGVLRSLEQGLVDQALVVEQAAGRG